MSHRRLSSIVLASLCLAMFATAALADPPARVGRVSRIDGAVTVLGPEPGTADTASVNYPAAAGMRFSSDTGSRMELDFGTVRARIDGRSDLEIQALDDKVLGLRLTLGSVNIRVREVGADERITVGTSDGQIVLTKAGAYRIDAPGQGASSTGNAPYRAVTHVVVFDGVARIFSPHGSDDVFAGEAVDINAPRGTLRYSSADSIWLDDWAADREQQIAAAEAEAARYVDTDIAGSAQLSDAGAWEETPEYGTVWYPDAVPADWAPYQYGMWTWVAPWGWTWVDDQPWGFAPFHYGRWVRVHGRWGWCPPVERHQRHVYAPALVTFVGEQRHERRVRPNGWIPLQPGQSYKPPYTHGGDYVRDINRDHDGRHWDGKGWRNTAGGNNTGGGNDGRGNTGGGNTGAGNTGTTVITTTVHVPPGDGNAGDGFRHRHRTGNDNSAPISITDETFQRRPRPSVLAPVGAVAPMTTNPATPMTTNPAGTPPAPVGASPLVPQANTAGTDDRDGDRSDRRRTWITRNPDGRQWGGRNWDNRPSENQPSNNRTWDNRTWNNRTGDPRNVPTPPTPAPPQTVTTAPPTMPTTVDLPGGGRVQIPTMPTPTTTVVPQVQQPVVAPPQVTAPGGAPDMGGYAARIPHPTGNMGSAPMENPFNRMRPNPAGTTPQIPTAAPSLAPTMPAQPVYQPMVPQAPAPQAQPAMPPAGQHVFIPGVGSVAIPPNAGRGNFGQGNVGAGNTGQ